MKVKPEILSPALDKLVQDGKTNTQCQSLSSWRMESKRGLGSLDVFVPLTIVMFCRKLSKSHQDSKNHDKDAPLPSSIKDKGMKFVAKYLCSSINVDCNYGINTGHRGLFLMSMVPDAINTPEINGFMCCIYIPNSLPLSQVS